MSAKYTSAPEFKIEGEPAAIHERTAVMRARASDFDVLADSLRSLSTDGWVGRAADRFRARFEVEPDRWSNAASEFRDAANSLDAYAEVLSSAQESAQICKQNYDEGNRQTEIAKEQYDNDVAEGYRKKDAWEAKNGPGTFTLTIQPFEDPGKALRDKAVSDFASLITNLEKQAGTTANDVRSACDGADAARNWLESGLAFLGGIVMGAVEAVVDIAKLLIDLQYGPLMDLYKVATGELTLEEWAAKQKIPLETAMQAFEAFKNDPIGFGANVISAVLDVDTWKDDPARALGHLVPDVLAAVFSGGSSAAATRGAKIADNIDDIGDGIRAADRAADAADAANDISRGTRGANAAADTSKIADAADDLKDASKAGRRAEHATDSTDARRAEHATDSTDARRATEKPTTTADSAPGGSGSSRGAGSTGDASQAARSTDHAADAGRAADKTDDASRASRGSETVDDAAQARKAEDTADASHGAGKADETADASHGSDKVGDETGNRSPQEGDKPADPIDPAEQERLRSQPPESTEDLLQAIPDETRPPSSDAAPYAQEGKTPLTDSSSLVENPREFFGEGKSYKDWVDEYTQIGKNGERETRWPKPGQEIMEDAPTKYTNVDDYISKHGDTLDRIGGPNGSYLGGVEKGRVPSFEERSISPQSIHEPYYQYKFSGEKLPSGYRIETGTVSPWHGAKGGARQVQVFNGDKPVPVYQLLKDGILEGVEDFVGLP